MAAVPPRGSERIESWDDAARYWPDIASRDQSDAIASLAGWAQAMAASPGAAEFLARPNLPYIHDNYAAARLAADRIDTVLIIDREHAPRFWRRISDPNNRGFPDARRFLAELPPLTTLGPLETRVRTATLPLSRGPTMIAAAPIFAVGKARLLRGWLIVARASGGAAASPFGGHSPFAVPDPGLKGPVGLINVSLRPVTAFLPALQFPATPSHHVGQPAAPRGTGVGPRKDRPWWTYAVLVGGLAASLSWKTRRRSRITGSLPAVPRAGTAALAVAASDGPVAASARTPMAEAILPFIVDRSEPSIEAVGESSEQPSAADPVVAVSRGTVRATDDSRDPSTVAVRAQLESPCLELRYAVQIRLSRDRIEALDAQLVIVEHGATQAATALVDAAVGAGLALELAERWLRLACADRREWQRVSDSEVVVSVPVSQAAIEHPVFGAMLHRVTIEAGIPLSLIELVVPLTALTSAVARVALSAVSVAGVRIGARGDHAGQRDLDSLTFPRLRKLILNAGSTRSNLRHEPENAWRRAVIGAARGLGLDVCLVGVDSLEVAEAAALHGDVLAVGSFVGAPMDRFDVSRLLAARSGDTAELPVLVLEDE